MKILVNVFCGNCANEITYVRLIADKPNNIQHYWKSFTNWIDIDIDRLILVWPLVSRGISEKVEVARFSRPRPKIEIRYEFGLKITLKSLECK